MADKVAKSELEAAQLKSENNLSTVADVLEQMTGQGSLAAGLGSSWSVSRAWFAVNGNIERAATCGVYLDDKPGRRTLIVYVDTRGHMVDFNANREIYLARMNAAGWDLSEVRFMQSKRPKAVVENRSKPAPELPELTPEEDLRAQELAAKAPESMREAILTAIRATMRGEKARQD